MDQAWFTLDQARNALIQARNALIEARFVADETYWTWLRRGESTCKWMWAAGLGGNMGLGGAAEQGSETHESASSAPRLRRLWPIQRQQCDQRPSESGIHPGERSALTKSSMLVSVSCSTLRPSGRT
jgi:hypothetical protein